MARLAPPRATAAAGAAGAALLIALSVALKLTVDASGPLWLDEGWSLGIVNCATLAEFAVQLRADVNPPLYFVLLRGWTFLFGDGNGALRALSALAACALPLAALLPGAGADVRGRWSWALALALWSPGLHFAQEARGYALLALLAAAQTALFAHLLAGPSLRAAFAWTAAAALTALTQHHAVLLTAAQGLLLLGLLRREALRLWPAALAYLPALAWELLQAPRVLVFSRPEHAWYPPFDAALGAAAAEVMVGAWPVALASVALAGAGAALRPRAEAAAPGERALWASAAASLAGGAALIALGALKPSLAPRYLVPFAPGALLVPVLLLGAARGWAREAARVGLALLAAAGLFTAAASADNRGRRAYQFETASADLLHAGARRLVFLWDNPTDAALLPAERAALADAFLLRAVHPLPVQGVSLHPGEDPNTALVSAANAPDDALLWLYDLRVPRTAARRFPPRLEALDRDLSCRRYAGGALGVVACVRSPAAWTR